MDACERGTRTLTADDYRASLLVLLNTVEDFTSALIAAELRELEPVYDQNISERADVAKAAEGKLAAPLAQLAALDREIQDTIGRVSEYEARLTDSAAETRVEAHRWFREWSGELDRLNEKKGELERDLGVLQAEYAKARSDAENAIMGKITLAAAIANPLTHEMGQWTRAYGQFRLPMTWQIIISGDRDHPEYQQALDQVRELAAIAGFKLVPDDQATRKMWDEYSERKTAEATRQPSAQDVINRDHAIMERLGADRVHHDVIEDFRRPELRLPWRDVR